MVKTMGMEFGIKLAELAGLDPADCTGFTIKRYASSATTVTFEIILNTGQEGALITELRRYKLVPIDEEGEPDGEE